MQNRSIFLSGLGLFIFGPASKTAQRLRRINTRNNQLCLTFDSVDFPPPNRWQGAHNPQEAW